MDFASVAIAVTLFMVFYQGVGLYLESRQSRSAAWTRRSEQQSTLAAGIREVIHKVSDFGPNRAILRNKKTRDRFDLLLVRSGNIFGWKAEDLLFYKEFGGILGIVFMWKLDITQPLAWIAAAYIGFIFAELFVKGKASTRQAEIQRNLPGFVDLIALALDSGLDLLAAIERIMAKMKPNALRDELQILIQENRLGTSRKESLQHLAYRSPLPDIQSLTAMIIQSEELGTSLASVLRSYTEDMRNRRIMRAEEAAGKMPVKILFPMMVFFFPIVFVIIFGPLALNFISTYK